MSILQNDAQSRAAQNNAMMIPPIAPASGGAGVSTISSAAGRNASSSGAALGRSGKIRPWPSELHGCLPVAGGETHSDRRY